MVTDATPALLAPGLCLDVIIRRRSVVPLNGADSRLFLGAVLLICVQSAKYFPDDLLENL